jgi:predicted kinase
VLFRSPIIGAEIIQSDAVRKEMLRIPASEHRYDEFGQGIYSPDTSRKTYEKALEIALEKLKTDRAVIVDASYQSREERLLAFEAGRQAGADVYVVECTCPEEIIERRLNSRQSRGGDISDGRWEIFRAQKENYERIDEIPERFHLAVDTSQAAEEIAVAVVRKMSGLE